MNGDDHAPPAGAGAQGNTRVALFSEQVSELLDLSEMADNIKTLAVQVEVRMLGHSGPHGETPKEQVYDESSPLSLIASMRNYTRMTRESLQTISDSLNRIDNELGGVGLSEPMKDERSGVPAMTMAAR